MTEKTTDLIDYLRVLRRRKWLILIPTFLCVAAVGVLSFLLPKKWEVDCIIKPGKFLIQTEAGSFQEVNVGDPRQITALINEDALAVPVAEQLNLSLRKFPRIRASILDKTQLIKVSLRTQDREQGKVLLERIFDLLKQDFDKKINVEIRQLETQVANNENRLQELELEINDKQNRIKLTGNEIKLRTIDIKARENQKEEKQQEIESTKNVLTISHQRSESLLKEMQEVKARIQRIEAQQEKVMAEEKTEALSLLLYSNEIQESLRYSNSLDRELTGERTRQENLKLDIQKKTEEIKRLDMQIEAIRTQIDTLKAQIDDILNSIEKTRNQKKTVQNDILLLNDRKARVEFSRLVKAPTPSIFPVSPNKRLNVLMAAILGLVCFTMAAFFLEYTREVK